MKANSSRLGSAVSAPPAALAPIRSYSDLQRQIHQDLRRQHPEWVEPSGDSPICDFYERRLAELIRHFQSSEQNFAAA